MSILKSILVFSILCFLFQYCSIKKGYDLYLVMSRRCKINAESKVLFGGKEIGQVEDVSVKDANTIMLKLIIHDGVRIPKGYDVKCRENILGDTFIDIAPESKDLTDKSSYLRDKDTLSGIYAPRFKKLDSSAKKELFQKLNDLKNTVDSIVKENDSAADR